MRPVRGEELDTKPQGYDDGVTRDETWEALDGQLLAETEVTAGACISHGIC